MGTATGTMATKREPSLLTFSVICLLVLFGLVAAQRPRASFTGIRWRYQPTQLETSAASDGRLNVSINIGPQSERVSGNQLWAVDFFASNNAQGSGQKFYLREQILSPIQQRQTLDNTADFLNFLVDVDMDLYRIGCSPDQPSFLCVRFYQGASTQYIFPTFGGPEPGLVLCRPARCYVSRGTTGGGGSHTSSSSSSHSSSSHGGGGPQPGGQRTARIYRLGWDMDPFQIQRGSASDITLNVDVQPRGAANDISGTGLWELHMFGSTNGDGSGPRYNPSGNLLDPGQAATPLVGTNLLELSVNTAYDVGAIGCTQVDHLCVEFAKGENPSPDYIFPPNNGRASVISCQRRDCAFNGQSQGPRHSATFSSFSFTAESTNVQTGGGYTNMDISMTGSTTQSSGAISGSNLWKLSVFGSKNRDGSGPRRNQVENVLDANAASQGLIPGEDLDLNSNVDLNLNGIGRDHEYPYLCMEFSKGDNASPDFDLPLPGGSMISCNVVEGQQVPSTALTGFSKTVGFGSTKPDKTTPTTIQVNAVMRGNENPITGTNLWQLGIFGSGNSDGSGPMIPIADQVLPPADADKVLEPNEDLTFDVTADLDLNDIGIGTDYPYICTKFGRHPLADPPFSLQMGGQDQLISCERFNRRPVEDTEPQPVSVNGFRGIISTASDKDDGTTPTTVDATVSTKGPGDPVTGTDLWKLDILGSELPDGTGELLPIAEQILPPDEASKPLQPGEDLQLTSTLDLDLNSIGPGTDYPYICTRFSKHPDADPDYDIEMGGADSLLSCTNFDRQPVVPPEPLDVVVTAVTPEKDVTITASTDNDVTFTVDIDVDPEETDNIQGRNLWDLDVWISANKNGKGKKFGHSQSVLTNRQEDQPLSSEGPLDFPAISTNIDVTGSKCKVLKFLCAEIKRQDISNPEFNFRGETPTSTVGCSKLTCKRFKKPKGVVVTSVQPTPIIVYENQVNEFEFDSTVTFDPKKSRPIAKGTKFWKLGAWLAREPDSPRKIGEEVQVLNNKKRDKKIYDHNLPTVFGGIPMTVDLTGVTCNKVNYLCNKFKLDKPTPKFLLTKASPTADVGCAPVKCKVPGEEEETPEVEVVATTTTPVTIYLNENNDVTTSPEVMFNTDDEIIGRDNWEVSTWFSEQPDGTGPKTNLDEDTLPEHLKHLPVLPDEPLEFPDLPQNADLTDGSDCSRFKYICAEIRKDRPDPDFELLEAKRFSRRGCAQVTCKERDEEVPVVEFMSVEPTPVTLYLGEPNDVTTDVSVEFNEDTTDPDVEGEELWQMAVWFSKTDTGKGSKQGFVKSAMTDEQGAMPVDFDEFVAEGLPLTADLTDKENCNKYQYICARVRKDNPSPDYEQKGKDKTGCAPVTCEVRPEGVAPLVPDEPDYPTAPTDLKPYEPFEPNYPIGFYVEVVETTAQPVVLHPNENNDVTTDVAVQFDTPFVIKGGNLWEMSTWFSKYPDGSGTRLSEKDKSLNQRQKNKPAKIDKDLNFQELPQNVDLTGSPDCGDYKYICGEIRKDRPNPDFVLVKRYRDSKIGCAKVTCEVRGEEETPAVEFASVTPTPVTLYIGEKNDVMTNVAVEFNEETTDPNVAGEELWQMSVWFSKSETGAGQVKSLVRSALNDEQGQMPVNFDSFVAEDLPATADLTDLVSCNKYAYICARIRKDDPNPDYKQIGKDKTGCAPVDCQERDLQAVEPDDEEYPEAGYVEVVATTTTPVTLYLNENNDVTTDVSVQFDTPYNIEGTDLWEMSIWFSKNEDGSGKQTNLREETLSDRQKNKPVKVDKDLTYVDLEQNVDLTDGTGCGKYRFICSEIRKNNPDPDFALYDRFRYSRRGCAPVTCNERDVVETPTVEFASVQPTPVTLYIGEENEVTTDVAVQFNEDTTDPTVAGDELWQMSVWFSKSDDGLGPVKGYVKSALSDEQGQTPVDFDNFVMEDLETTADLTDLVSCNKYKYICARVRKDKPSPDYEQIGKDKTGCAPVTCKVREEEPDEYIEIVATSTTPVTLYLNEDNDVTTDVKVEFEAPYKIEGNNLWEMAVWFSKYPDGSGEQTNLRPKTLNQRQKDKTLKPDKDLGFAELEQNADLTGISDCEDYQYICSEISKDDPDPDFEMFRRYRGSKRGCAKVTCIDRSEPDPRTVQFQSVMPTPVELIVGERTTVFTDVTVRFNEENTDPDTAGEELWQMAVWFSKDSDGVGSSTGFVESALTDEQGTKPVDFDDFVMEDLPMTVDLIGSVACAKYKYLCARVRKDNPKPDYKLLGKSRDAITGCVPATCSIPEEEEEEPFPPEEEESIIEVVATTTTPVTLYLNEENDVTTDVDIAFDTDVNIKGTDLWEMSIWFSKQKDGSGKQTNLRSEVLSPRQKNKSVKPDKPLTYVELPQSVDLTDGTGCGKYKYICSELRKNDPNPDFELIDRYRFSRRGCAQVTCEDRNEETPTVQFRKTQPTPVTLYVGEKNDVTTDVTVKFMESNTDPTVAGEQLWQMALWFSKSDDGVGSSTGFVESTLNEAQGSKPVDFDDFVMEDLPMTVDLTDSDGCGKYKFICARVRKDSPTPDYKLVGKDQSAIVGCAPVTCETRDDEEQILEIVSTTPTPVTLYTDEVNEVTTDITVEWDADYGVNGRDNWEMSVWYSKLADGSGKQTDLDENALIRPQRNQPLTIDDPLVFEGVRSTVDLTGGLGCGKYKYICAEIRKSNPDPKFDYTLRKNSSPRGCAKVTCIAREDVTPTVQFKSVQPTPITLVVGQENEVTTDVTIEFNEDNTDESTSGTNLWELTLWFSKSEDGSGSSTDLRDETLSQEQKDMPVNFADFEFTGMELSVDLTGFIGCGKYRYICARIRKNDPEPDYELVGKSPEATSGCAPVTCDAPEEEEEEPLVIVSTAITPETLILGEENTVYPDVTVEFEGEEGVSGTDLWEMTVFFNKNGDGSGKRTSEATSTLTQSQKDQPLVITESLVFEDIEKDLDLTDAEGCGKYKYICAEIRKDDPSPPFEYEKKKSLSTRGCAKTSCEVREEEEPTVQFASTQPSPVTIYEEELNVVNTDVVITFNEPNTDPTVAGEDLWQLQVWFSKAEDGQGSSIGMIQEALTEEQANKPVDFSDFTFEGVEARADLTAQGCGKFRYICARIRKDRPNPDYELVGKDPAATTGCAPVECLRGRDPTVEFASVQPTPVQVFEISETTVTTTVTVTFNEDRTDQVSGDNLWQVDLWFSKASDGAGSSSDGVSDVLSPAHASQPVDFDNFQFEDLEITADLRNSVCGRYRYICAQVRRDEPEPTYKLLGRERSSTVGCAEVRCDRSQEPTVEFASITLTGVTVYEERENPVTTTVSVDFKESTTEEGVSGSNLWQVTLWFSKAPDGLGSQTGTVESALSPAQGAQPVSFDSFQFEDLEITADLTSVGCGKFRYICGRIRRDKPDPSYILLSRTLESTSGCAPVDCSRSTLDSALVTSVTNTPVTISPEQNNEVTTDVTVTFDGGATDDISGSNLWRVEVWYSKKEDGSGFRSSYTQQALSPSQQRQAIRGNTLRFNAAVADADLSGVGCGKYLFVCARIKKGEADPDFELLDEGIESITGCSPVTCGEEEQETPHITPTSITVFPSPRRVPLAVTVGEENVLRMDLSIEFDPSDTDSVSGSNNWKIIVWLSNQGNGNTGTRVAETEDTITTPQINKNLVAPGPLNFQGVSVTMDLTRQKCKNIAFVCARLKKANPNPDYTMTPKQISGCSPCSCST